MVPIDSAFMSYTRVLSETEGARDRADRLKNMLSELEKAPASPAEKAVRAQLIRAELEKAEADITPEAVSVEDAAGELMYRYWLGRKTGETGDFSDIVERNESTDLFLWDARLAAERTALGVLKPLETVERGEARILEMTEADGLIAAKLYVHTEISDGISRGVGEEIVLTLRRSGGRLVIVGFDREVGDGLYVNSLKPLANRYRTQGLSWREAGEKAYEALHAQLENEAEWAANYRKTDDGR